MEKLAVVFLFIMTREMQLDESTQANQQLWDPNAHAVAYGRQQPQPQGDGFFQPIECEPTLQIG